MTLNRLFSPFSQKYLLQKRRLPDHTEGALRLLIDADLDWHWGVRDDKLYVEIARDFEKLIESGFNLYSPESECVVNRQPTWGMGQCVQERAPPSERRGGEERPWNDPVEKAEPNPLCGEWRMEHLAYYSPAHSVDAERYGIHLTKRGIAKVAHQVHRLCPEQPLAIIQMAAVYKLFAHELCHAWIEDICCLIEFSEGVSVPKSERRYTKIQKQYNGYIFMEEALCNTAAHGWLHQFLQISSEDRKPTLPPFDADVIINAFAQWMRQQPQGYRDFLAITEVPPESEIFVQNVCRLLVEVYGIDRYGCYRRHSRPWNDGLFDEVPEVVGAFFGGYLTRDCRHFSSRRTNRWNSLWAGEPPLHVEL